MNGYLAKLSPESEPITPGEPQRIDLDDVREIPTIELPYGLVPVTVASAGMQRILSLAYMMVWTWAEYEAAAKLTGIEKTRQMVVLIDEVEAHLHPAWQRTIVPSLLSVAEAMGLDVDIQFFITTHSPMVLASLEPYFDTERDRLFHLDIADGRVTVDDSLWRKRGDASAWLTSEVFGLKQARAVEAERAIERALAAMADDTVPRPEIEAIHEALRQVLKEVDPFWPQWLLRARKAGMEV